jgi:Prealbumin-like fold domain
VHRLTTSRRRRRVVLTLFAAAALVVTIPGLIIAGNLPQPGGPPNDPQFEVDGNLLSEAAGKIDWAVGTAGSGVITATRNANGTCTQTNGTFQLGGPGQAGKGVLICDGSVGNFADANGFTQGSHEESGPNPEPWQVSAVSSPKKADLAEVSVYGKVFDSAFDADTNADDLAFVVDLTRLDVNGDTHADFEFNQTAAVTPCANPADGNLCQPRIPGDFIVSFDLPRGGSTPTETFYKFEDNNTKTAGAVCADTPQASFANGCYVEIPAPAAPILGEPGAFAILNSVEIPAAPWKSVGCERTTDHNAPGCEIRTNIPARGNMEGYVDLTAFLGNDFSLCPGFGQVTPKTRSSDGLNSSLQDVAGPVPITAKICGSLLIKKFGPDGTTLLPGAGYTITPSTIDRTGTQVVADGGTADVADGNDGVVCLDGVLFGGYAIQETTVPSGYFGDTSTKNVTVSPSASTCADRLAGGNAAATADASFTNTLGSILIKKLKRNADGTTSLVGGAVFTVTPDPSISSPGASKDITDNGTGDVSAAAGVVCIDGVRNLGTGNDYTVTEKTPPSGFFGDSNSITVGVHSPSKCADRLDANGLPTGSVDATFTNVKGSLLIRKEAKNANCTGATPPAGCFAEGKALFGGASFTISPDPTDNVGTLTITDNGTGDANSTAGLICIDDVFNIGSGNYTITESNTNNANYAKDASTKTVAIGSVSKTLCSGRTVSAGNEDAKFVNIPLSSIGVTFNSSAGPGVTKASIVCATGSPLVPIAASSENGSADPALDDSNEAFTGLQPGTYTCTVVVDP